MEIIYNYTLKHTKIRNLDSKEIKLSSGINEEAHIAATPSKLSDVIAFYRENHACYKLLVLAESYADAQAAISANCNFIYKDEKYNVKKLTSDETKLLKLSFTALKKFANPLAMSYVISAISKNHSITTQEIARKLLDTKAQIDNEIIFEFPAQRIKEIEDKTRSGLSITNTEGLDIRTVSHPSEIDLNEIMAGGVTINRAGTGFGKSIIARQLCEMSERSLYTAHLRSIVHSNLPSATHYEHIVPGTQCEIKSLKTVINSIAKYSVQEFIKCAPIDVLVIEEAHQLFDQFIDGKFDGKNCDKEACWHKLNEVIRSARVIYIADADFSDLDLEYIKSIRGNDKYTVYETERDLDVTATILGYKEAESRAIDEMYNRKAFIATDNKQFVLDHVENLKGKKNVLGITGKNINDHIDILSDPNSISDNFDGFMTSPAIQSSVSITSGDFTGCFVLLNGIIPPGSGVQMARRYRIADSFIFAAKPGMEILTDTTEGLLEEWRSEGSEFDVFAAKRKASSNFMKNNIVVALPVALKLAGIKVIKKNEVNEALQKRSTKINSEASKKETEAYEKKLLAATPARRDEIKNARLSGETTNDLSVRVDRAELQKLVGTSQITMKHIKDYGRGALAKKIRNFEIARLTNNRLESLMGKETSKSTMDRFDWKGHADIVRIIFQELHIDPVTGMGGFTPEDANRLRDRLYSMRDVFNSLDLNKKLPKKMPKTFTKPAKDLLTEMGLKVDKNVINKRIDGKLVRIYRITMDSAETMQTYLACRQGKASSFSTLEI